MDRVRFAGIIRDTLVDHVEFHVHGPALRDGRFGQGTRRGRERQSDRLAGSLLAPRMFLAIDLIINSTPHSPPGPPDLAAGGEALSASPGARAY